MAKKIFLTSILLLLLGVSIYYLIPKGNVDNQFDSESIDLVPYDAFAILKSNAPFKAAEKLFSSSFGKSFFAFEEGEKLRTNIFALEKIIENNTSVNELLKDKNLLLSFHKVGVNNNAYLFISKINTKVKQSLGEVIKSSKLSEAVKSKHYEEAEIFSIQIHSDLKIHVVQLGQCISISNSLILTEKAVLHYKHGVSLTKKAGFKKLYQTANDYSDFNVFVNFPAIAAYLKNISSKDFEIIENKVALFGDWMELDAQVKSEHLMLNGLSYVDDSSRTFLQSFKHTQPQKLHIASVLPSNTAFFTFMGFGDFKQFNENFKLYLDKKQVLYTRDKNIQQINQKHPFSVEKDFFSWIGGDICAFITEGKQQNVLENYAVAFKIKDIEQANTALTKILAATNGNEEEINYLNYKIGNLKLHNFLPLVLGDFYAGITGSYYVIVEDYFIVGNDVSNLKNLIYSYLKGKTLIKNIHFNKFMNNLPDASSFLIYGNFKRMDNFWQAFLSPNLGKQFTSVLDSIQQLDGFALQFTNNANLFLTNVFMNKKTIQEDQAISLIEFSLDTSYHLQPWLVKNHYTGENELLIQDLKNNLYLINNVGKILWKKKLDNQIIGDVVLVDRYKNKKFQYLFGTGNSLYLIDRNGNFVEGYPVKLKEPQTQGLSVLDYDNNRNYRILVTSNTQIFNYGIDGKKVDGWEFKSNQQAIATAPKLLQVAQKDYLIVPDVSGKVRILDRKGKDRLELNHQLPKGRNKYEVLLQPSLSSSGVLTTDTNGTLFLLKLTDELEAITIKAFSAQHEFYLSNVNSENAKDVVYFDEETVYAYKLSKKPITQIKKIPFTPSFGVQFHHAGEQVIFTLSNAETGKIYAYDVEGILMENFPIEAQTPSFIVDLDGDKKYEFIVGDAFGSVYIYKIL